MAAFEAHGRESSADEAQSAAVAELLEPDLGKPVCVPRNLVEMRIWSWQP